MKQKKNGGFKGIYKCYENHGVLKFIKQKMKLPHSTRSTTCLVRFLGVNRMPVRTKFDSELFINFKITFKTFTTYHVLQNRHSQPTHFSILIM
jgi:hypothetical protein